MPPTFVELLLWLDRAGFRAIYEGLRDLLSPDDPRRRYTDLSIDHLFRFGDHAGEFLIAVPVLVGLVYVSKTLAQYRARVLLLVLGVALGMGVVGAIKKSTDRTRPLHAFETPGPPQWHYSAPRDEQGRERWAGPPPWLREFLGVTVNVDDPWMPLLASRGFPSGHTQFAFAICTALSCWFWRLRAGFMVWAWLCGVARIYGGHHFPADVLVAALAGWGSVVLVFAIARRIVGPTPGGWRKWLASGLPPVQPAVPRARRLSRHVAFWSAFGMWVGTLLLVAWFGSRMPIADWLPLLPAIMAPLTWLVVRHGSELALQRAFGFKPGAKRHRTGGDRDDGSPPPPPDASANPLNVKRRALPYLGTHPAAP